MAGTPLSLPTVGATRHGQRRRQGPAPPSTGVAFPPVAPLVLALSSMHTNESRWLDVDSLLDLWRSPLPFLGGGPRWRA